MNCSMTVATSSGGSGETSAQHGGQLGLVAAPAQRLFEVFVEDDQLLQHPLADPPLRRGELLEDPVGHRPQCALHVRQRIDLLLGDQVQRLALRIPGSRVPQSAQSELQQRQSVGKAGGLTGELVDEAGWAEAKANLLGRFRNGALDLQEADRGEVGFVVLPQQPHVQSFQGIAAFEARQMVGAQGEQDAARKAPGDSIRFGERAKQIAERLLFIRVAAQREQFFELVDDQQERLAVAPFRQRGRRIVRLRGDRALDFRCQ